MSQMNFEPRTERTKTEDGLDVSVCATHAYPTTIHPADPRFWDHLAIDHVIIEGPDGEIWELTGREARAVLEFDLEALF
jgi:hypothetical protein